MSTFRKNTLASQDIHHREAREAAVKAAEAVLQQLDGTLGECARVGRQ